MNATEVLNILKEGNRRWVEDPEVSLHTTSQSRTDSATTQDPIAIVIACSDSRVPVNSIFNQGIGKLFIVRLAGNIVTPNVIGSIEYAITEFTTQLMLVLGHSGCGAVCATIEQLKNPTERLSPGLKSIIEQIKPSAQSVMKAGHELSDSELLAQAVSANVDASVSRLVGQSDIIAERMQAGTLKILGAEYDLASGIVRFHEEEG
jgi:carbonic anhydrase